MALTQLNKDSFNQTVSQKGIAVVEFYSEWCSVCKVLQPVLEEMAQKYSSMKFCKINAEENRSICLSQRVLSLPTTLIFKDGSIVEKIIGFKSKEDIAQMLSKLM